MLSNSHFERLLVDCQPLDVQLDEEFLLTAVEFVRSVVSELGGSGGVSGGGVSAATAAAAAAATEPGIVLSDFFRNSHMDITAMDKRQSSDAAAKGASWLYFRDFCLRELQVYLTLTRSPRAESSRRHLSTVVVLPSTVLLGTPCSRVSRNTSRANTPQPTCDKVRLGSEGEERRRREYGTRLEDSPQRICSVGGLSVST